MERKTCIWCQSPSLSCLFRDDKVAPVASYNLSEKETYETVPFNIQRCNQCNTYQVKYVADPALLYKKSHALCYSDSLHVQNKAFREFIFQNTTPRDVVEVGAGNGFIADLLLQDNRLNSYTIIDPTYFGNKQSRHVIDSFFEDVNPSLINQDTLVMSHVYEHFYTPHDVMKKINDLKTIRNVYIIFPNLESFLAILHMNVLNLEHSFFVGNDFITSVFSNYGFTLVDYCNYDNHAVFFHFERSDTVTPLSLVHKNCDTLVYEFFNRIENSIKTINDRLSTKGDLPVYIWPSSHQTQYLFMNGLDYTKIDGLLDNHPSKLNSYLYGYDILCSSFKEIMTNGKPGLIILNGGCYNSEILKEYESHRFNKEFIVI
jgi:hypothetical protein